VTTAVPSFRSDADRDLEVRIEALRQEVAGLMVELRNTTQRLEDVAEELGSRRQTDNVVALDQAPRRKRGRDPDLLIDFLE
jgi:hypothetical protein